MAVSSFFLLQSFAYVSVFNSSGRMNSQAGDQRKPKRPRSDLGNSSSSSQPSGKQDKRKNFHAKRNKSGKDGKTLAVDSSASNDNRGSSSNSSAWTARLSRAALSRAANVKKARDQTSDRTVSIAFPSSILRHTHSQEQKTFIIGQIARACALFEVNEIIVFIDTVAEQCSDPERAPSHSICRILQYLETPSYLRRTLFPFHSDFKHIGLLPTLDMPHHMRKEDDSWYREGVTLPSHGGVTEVDVGLGRNIQIDKLISPGVRVTVQLSDAKKGVVVSPDTPRQHHGLYWGYQTRLAQSFGDVFTSSPFATENGSLNEDGAEQQQQLQQKSPYDCIIGYSETGDLDLDRGGLSLSESCRHVLVVFGGENGIEGCIEADENFPLPSKEARSMFTHWLNLCPTNGCRVVRTEDCILASLARLRPVVAAAASANVATVA